MPGKRYRLRTPTLAIMTPPGAKPIPVTIPEEAIVTVVNGPLEGKRLVSVDWDGNQALIFTTDLQERGTVIDPD